MVTNGFNHFDGHQLIEFTGQITIILFEKGDLTFKPGIQNALPGIFMLFVGYSGRGHANPVMFGRIHGESAPAGADFHHMVAGCELQFAQE